MNDLDAEIDRLERELADLKAQRARVHRIEHCLRLHCNPAVVAKQSDSMLAAWRDPAKRARMLDGRRRVALAKRKAANGAAA